MHCCCRKCDKKMLTNCKSADAFLHKIGANATMKRPTGFGWANTAILCMKHFVEQLLGSNLRWWQPSYEAAGRFISHRVVPGLRWRGHTTAAGAGLHYTIVSGRRLELGARVRDAGVSEDGGGGYNARRTPMDVAALRPMLRPPAAAAALLCATTPRSPRRTTWHGDWRTGEEWRGVG